ncbi:MAG: phytanoyl-CoA dioxygenase family protein [Bacteroidetes bacterium]|nr:phytanoyl-CoA dioxygenase family protein [Bacteroidota bacterium]
MIPAIFKNKQLQEEFDKNGFVKISLLDQTDVEKLLRLYGHYFPKPSENFFSSSYESDFSLKKEISDAIGEIIFPKLNHVFVDFSWFGSAFLSKGNGARSEMPMHQDWTIVDESKYVALNIWTPLQDTDTYNGTLEVLAGSHKWHDVLRAPTLPFYYNGFQEQLKSKLTILPTKATEAIVLNQAVIHYSKPNKTDKTRIAITTGIKTVNAPMLFHYWDKNIPDVIEQFKQDDDFLLKFTDFHKDIFNRPQIGESIGTESFKYRVADAEEIARLISPKKKTLLEKLKLLLRN